MAFFFHKIIPAQTKYKTHNSNFLAIIEVFKMWKYYLKDYKYKVLVLLNYHNLEQFKNTKNLSFR